jgi:pyruvate ferredoxin oxidoreductase delta subunit
MEYVGWEEVSTGAVLPSFTKEVENIAGMKQEDRPYAKTNSFSASVADWRVAKPIYNRDYCIDCQFCWIFCPDTSIVSRDKKMVGIDYDHCKGCGVCVEVCPTNPKSLLMFNETLDNDVALTQWPAKQ